MVLSKRERYIANIMVATVATLMVYQFVAQPLLDQKTGLDSQIAIAQQNLNNANQVMMTSHRLTPRWTEMAANGLRRSASETESQLYNQISAWALDAGLVLPAVKSDRTERVKDFNKFTVRASGAGSMQQIARFLYQIQTASMPVHVSDLQINSRKEGTGDLAIQLAISTIYLAADDKPHKTADNLTDTAPSLKLDQ